MPGNPVFGLLSVIERFFCFVFFSNLINTFATHMHSYTASLVTTNNWIHMQPLCTYDLIFIVFPFSISDSSSPTAEQSYKTSQLILTGDICFGERVHDDRDDLLAGGSWPTLDNSSRLNRHTWSALQPSAGTMGVWGRDTPLERPLPRPGLDSVQVVTAYAVIYEPVPNYTSSDMFMAWNKAQFDSQL